MRDEDRARSGRPRPAAILGATLAAALVLGSCRKVVDSLAIVQLEQHAATISVGGSTTLQLLAVDPPGYVPDVKWSSSDPATASVQRTGTLTADVLGLKPGQVRIVVAGAGSADTALVSVLATTSGARRWAPGPGRR